MKVLIITYYWPPAGGSGVQRWLYFTKYLREFGIEPIIFTVKNPNYPIEDESLQSLLASDIKIIRQRIWEPNNFLNKKRKKTAAGFLSQNPSFTQRIFQYVRANYFIPDARKFWIKPSVKKITKYLENNDIDWVITTGPPHSVHLIGQAVKEKTKIKWLADFRDPWTEIDYFHQLPLTKKSISIHHKLENSVLNNANIVSVVGQTMAEKYKKINRHTHVLSNGFDADISQEDIKLDDLFSLTHVGLLNADRNPKLFWEVIKELIESNNAFKDRIRINLIGKIAEEVKTSIKKNKLDACVKIIDYIPFTEVRNRLIKSQILLLFVNNVPSAKGIVTGKVFEYLSARRPIIAIGPKDGDLETILNQTQSGALFDFNDKETLKKQIVAHYANYTQNQLKSKSKDIDRYHRKNLTSQLAKLLKNN